MQSIMLRSSSGFSQEGKEPKFSGDRDHIGKDGSEDLLLMRPPHLFSKEG
jgi:hypothetical protein